MDDRAFSAEELQELKQAFLASLHCALPAVVESFDADTQTACVRPAVKRRHADTVFSLPLLRDVPVFFPGSRTAGITWPVSEGDECLVVFADSAIDQWFATGEAEEPGSGRSHDLSDAFAFVGFRSRPNALAEFPDAPRFFDGSVASHNHDDRYYTETETDTMLAGNPALPSGAGSVGKRVHFFCLCIAYTEAVWYIMPVIQEGRE